MCVGETAILLPQHKDKSAEEKEQQKQSERFRKRAGIEPVIGHLKTDHRMNRNFLSGKLGDQINVLMAAAGFNFRKWLRCFIAWILAWVIGIKSSSLAGNPLRFGWV